MTLRLGGDGAITGCTSLENPDLTVSGLTISGSFDAEKVLVSSGTAAAPSYTFSGDTDNGLYYAGTNSIGLSTGGTNAILIDSAGNVGIGTASPTQKLDVRGNIYVGDKIGINTTSPSQFLDIESGSSTSARITAHGYICRDNWGSASSLGNGMMSPATNSLAFTTNSNERMRITSAGGVGIGTSNPTNTLHVNGSTYVHNNLTVGAYDTSPYLRGMRLFPDNGGRSTLVLNGDGTSNTAIGIYDGNASGYKTKLQHDGGGYFLGMIGIGTTSPANPLHIANEYPFIRFQSNSGSYQGRNMLGQYQNIFYLEVDNDNVVSNSAFAIKVDNSEAMRISSSGNVGIGDSSPDARCVIYRPTQFAGNTVFSVKTDAGSPKSTKFMVDGDGNVGIGTTSPADKLHISNGAFAGVIVQSGRTTSGLNIGSLLFRDGSANNAAELLGEVGGSLVAKTAGSERMRIDSSGRWQNYSTDINGGAFRSSQGSSGGANIVAGYHSATSISNGTTAFYFLTNGGLANYQSNDSNLCDEREKKNIVSLDAKWDKVKSWELKKFHYNEDADTNDLRYGVIAQQIEEHCPEVLTNWQKQKAEDAVLDEDGNVVTPAKEEIIRKGVKEQQMMWMAIKALQEAMERIETLEAEVAELKNN